MSGKKWNGITAVVLCSSVCTQEDWRCSGSDIQRTVGVVLQSDDPRVCDIR